MPDRAKVYNVAGEDCDKSKEPAENPNPTDNVAEKPADKVNKEKLNKEVPRPSSPKVMPAPSDPPKEPKELEIVDLSKAPPPAAIEVVASDSVVNGDMTVQEGRKSISVASRNKSLAQEDSQKVFSLLAQSKEIDVSPKQFYFDPKTEFRRNWDVVMLWLLVFTALATPFEVAVLDLQKGETWFWIMFSVNFIVNLLFITDMVRCHPALGYRID
jgi:hypothetical protein